MEDYTMNEQNDLMRTIHELSGELGDLIVTRNRLSTQVESLLRASIEELTETLTPRDEAQRFLRKVMLRSRRGQWGFMLPIAVKLISLMPDWEMRLEADHLVGYLNKRWELAYSLDTDFITDYHDSDPVPEYMLGVTISYANTLGFETRLMVAE